MNFTTKQIERACDKDGRTGEEEEAEVMKKWVDYVFESFLSPLKL
jgi:hypothetical protein